MTKYKYKRSKQRDRVYELIKSSTAHPTASWVYDELKREFSHLSIGTVYRNINILMAQGLIRKIETGSSFDRFDAYMDQHYHFICRSCNRVLDLPLAPLEGLNETVSSQTGYSAEDHCIKFYGTCRSCQS